MPEVRRRRELHVALYMMHYVGLPAVVVRASGLADTGEYSHTEITRAVSDILIGNPELGWTPDGEGKTTRFPYTWKGRGDLHHDYHVSLKPKFRILRIGSGCGKGWVATAGELGFDYEIGLEEQIDLDFQAGKVDPQYVSPDFYVTDLDTDDKVIFPDSFPVGLAMAGPVWHAFDTSSDKRQGIVRTVPLTH